LLRGTKPRKNIGKDPSRESKEGSFEGLESAMDREHVSINSSLSSRKKNPRQLV
jgi:hypothetical protein